MTDPERTPQTAPDLEALPYPENEGGTHWEGCWRAPRHHNCAVREAISARAERDAARAEVERLRVNCAEALKMLKNVETCPREGNRLYCVACSESIEVAIAALSTEAAQ